MAHLSKHDKATKNKSMTLILELLVDQPNNPHVTFDFETQLFI
jgi:hypothetical protein